MQASTPGEHLPLLRDPGREHRPDAHGTITAVSIVPLKWERHAAYSRGILFPRGTTGSVVKMRFGPVHLDRQAREPFSLRALHWRRAAHGLRQDRRARPGELVFDELRLLPIALQWNLCLLQHRASTHQAARQIHRFLAHVAQRSRRPDPSLPPSRE